MDDKFDRTLEAFKRLVRYLRGSLWWGVNDLIKSRTPQFNQADKHHGHPLLSLRKDEVKTRMDAVPMLHGTSGTKMSDKGKRRCIVVTGMTRRDPTHITYFGSIIAPSLYDCADMIDGALPKRCERTIDRIRHETNRGQDGGRLRSKPWMAYHQMIPNWDKPMVNKAEMEMVEAFCLIHRL